MAEMNRNNTQQVPDFEKSNDKRLYGLWDLVGDAIRYENQEDIEKYHKMFSEDPIAYKVLKQLATRYQPSPIIHAHTIGHDIGEIQLLLADLKDSASEVLGDDYLKNAIQGTMLACIGSKFIVVTNSVMCGANIWAWELPEE